MAEFPDFHGDTPLNHIPKKESDGNCGCGTYCHCKIGCDCENCGCLSCSPVQSCGCKWNNCICEGVCECNGKCNCK